MRFFAHDGKSTHGPAGIEELLKLPGFDGDTLVCPVGSDDSADWKPALAYPSFKKALLEAPPPAPAAAPAAPPPPAPAPAPEAPKAELIPVPAPFPLPLPAAQPLPAAIAPPAALPLPPAPAPAAVTKPCPRCAHANLEDARFCNACGARMDGALEDISAPPPAQPAPVAAPLPDAVPAPVASPVPAPPPPAPAPAPVPEPAPTPFETAAPDPFSRLDPMLTFPAEPEPLPDSPRRPLQPGGMGQIAAQEAFEAPAPFAPPSPALAPEPAPAPASVPAWKRPIVLAVFVSAALAAAGLGYMMLGKPVPAEPVAELTPSAPLPAPEPTPPPPPVIYTPPPVTSSPAMPDPAAARPKKPAKAAVAPSAPAPVAAAKPKRPRRTRAARAPRPAPAPAAPVDSADGDTIIESRAPEPKHTGKPAAKDPLLEALLSDATQGSPEPLAEPAAEKAAPQIGQRPASKPGQFSLPGLKRPVSASDRAASAADAPLSEPGRPSPPPGIEDEPVKPAATAPSAAAAEPGPGEEPAPAAEPAGSAEGDQVALVQVHEQFDFCAQLLAQAAYGDHYDTCLCKDAREAAPYRGRRGFYVTAKKKDAAGGRLETSAKILSSKIDAGVAKVTARWKSGPDDKGRTVSHAWKLEDGLWCQAP